MTATDETSTWSLSPVPAGRGRFRVALLHGEDEVVSDTLDLQSARRRAQFAQVLHRHMRAVDVEAFEQALQELATQHAHPTHRSGAIAPTADALLTTDTGNARRLVELHGEDIRHVVGLGWHVWDGKRWAHDDHRRIDLLARDVAQSFIRDSERLIGDPQGIRLARHGHRSASRGRIDAAVALARSEPDLSVGAADLDRDPMLLNVDNGTLDLRTGRLREHRREDLLSKLAPVALDPSATCAAFGAFLGQILPDERTRAFVVRLLGYGLTGRIDEQVLPVLWGTGANGKSTLLGIILDLLGDYAAPLPPDLLMTSLGERHPTELARLRGLRLAVAQESESGRRLAESRVKQLTGGDPISARRMREDFFEFKPTHKLLLVTNHRPVIRGSDHGIWRRILLVPFSVEIPAERRDKALPERLRAELPGILNLLVRGCLEWQERGLQAPDVVRQATSNYQEEQDSLRDWLDECCVVRPDARANPTALWISYQVHAKGEDSLNRKGFAEALRERGFEQDRTGKGRWWCGIGLKAGSPSESSGTTEVTR